MAFTNEIKCSRPDGRPPIRSATEPAGRHVLEADLVDEGQGGQCLGGDGDRCLVAQPPRGARVHPTGGHGQGHRPLVPAGRHGGRAARWIRGVVGPGTGGIGVGHHPLVHGDVVGGGEHQAPRPAVVCHPEREVGAVVVADPARRAGGRRRFDPRDYIPALDRLAEVYRGRDLVVKCSPGIDFDALPTVDLDVPGYYKNRQFSQEIQFLINAGKLNGLIGAYYLNASALTQFESRLYTTINGFAAFTNADIGTDTLAGFADFSYDLTDQLSLSLGGRYTVDKRDGYILRQNYLGGGSPVFGSPGVAFGAAQTNFRGSSTFKKFTPKASLSFKPAPGQQVYASYSQGFKGGGFDPRGVGINAIDLNGDGTKSQDEIAKFLSFRPEKVNSYELGYKGDLFDRRVYIALAAFYMDYTDVQIPGSVACNAGGVATFCGVVSNAGKARMKGFEAETRAKLIQSDAGTLSFTGSLGYIDAKYTKYIANIASVPTDVAAFRKVQNTPAWSGAASLATVYNNLALFAKLQLLAAARTPDGEQRWDLRIDPHHHLSCQRCGRVFDIEPTAAEVVVPAPALRRRVAHAEVWLIGHCESCAPTP